MDRRPIKVAAVAPANKIARVAWNEEIGQELHTVPFIRPVAQLEASILDLNLILRHRQQATAPALRKLASREDVMNESKHTGFDTADITAYRISIVARCTADGVADPARRVDQLGCRDYRIGALADVQQRNGFAVAVGAGRIAGTASSIFFGFGRIGPILRGQGVQIDNGWNTTLYQDYIAPNLHITF